MSQIASFYLLKEGRRQELSNGDCSGAVYMAIWDWCESELDLDVRFPAPQTEETLDCALLEGELASKLLAALREQDLSLIHISIRSFRFMRTSWTINWNMIQTLC